jgi:hypothetical protein
VDLAERTVELNPGETKNDRGRVVVMTARAWELLQQMHRRQARRRVGLHPGERIRCSQLPADLDESMSRGRSS